jgi:hypothetical protein
MKNSSQTTANGAQKSLISKLQNPLRKIALTQISKSDFAGSISATC